MISIDHNTHASKKTGPVGTHTFVIDSMAFFSAADWLQASHQLHEPAN